jgi:ubiquinone/menaquinone biosynthesis C-methylase UbiE
MFDELLGTAFYSIIRAGCFDYLKRGERQWLDGKQLLEIGCGNGLETAEMWLLTNGKVNITAVDAVPGMLQLAEKQFEQYLDQIQPKHPSITDENRPVFKQANATNLPYEDNTFDAAFCFFLFHWTADPAIAIKEAVRVVRPGGLVFGAQSYKPYTNPYLNLVVRSSRNSYGFFWKEDVHRWFADCGLELDMVTPAGIFRARNTK